MGGMAKKQEQKKIRREYTCVCVCVRVCMHTCMCMQGQVEYMFLKIIIKPKMEN